MIKINIELNFHSDYFEDALCALKELNKSIDSIVGLDIDEVYTKVIESHEED